jgi:hypothetical protein
MDTAIVTLCADQYRPAADPADAIAEIWIDDIIQGQFPVQATPGQAQALLFQGVWPPSMKHKLVVYFKNDAWGGSSATDRNLYVLGVTIGGVFYPPPVPNELQTNSGSIEIDIPATAIPVPVVPVPAVPQPTGCPGVWTPIINATFGTSVAGSTVQTQANMFGEPKSLAYPWYIYSDAENNPTVPSWDGSYQVHGPWGDGCDGLYGNYRSRHKYFEEGSPQDVHVLGPDKLTLKAWCGLADGSANNCADPNIVSGILRFVQPIRPGSFVEIRCKMPKGMYSWPAFWLNPGEQAPWAAPGVPGKIASRNWPPEIDIFDEFGFNGVEPGHYLIAGTPTGGQDARFARPGEPGPLDLDPFYVPIPGVMEWTEGRPDDGWYGHPIADITADFHTYGLQWDTDGVLSFLFDGVVYRRRTYVWADTDPPAHLIASLQIGSYFNDLTQMVPQGGVPDGWDWDIQYIRAWTRDA